MKDITRLLNSASLTVTALTKCRKAAANDGKGPNDLEGQKTAFTSAASEYFSLLSSIDVQLRRQIYALEEADIISAEAPTKESQTSSVLPAAFAALGGGPSSTLSSQLSSEKGTTSASGMGNLDVGWLNSRNDAVGKEMEAELWAKARDFVETLADDAFGTTAEEAEGEAGRTTDSSHHVSG